MDRRGFLGAALLVSLLVPVPGTSGHEASTTGATATKKVSLRLSGNLKAEGDVTSDAAGCRDAAVKIQKKKTKGWSTVAKDRADASGHYSTKVPNVFGRYRALSPAEGGCPKATSGKRSYAKNDPTSVRDGDDVSGPLDLEKVRLDHDGRKLYVKIVTHDAFAYDDFRFSADRFVVIFPLGNGKRWEASFKASGDTGNESVVLSFILCDGNTCKGEGVRYGKAKKPGAKTLTGNFPLRFFEGDTKLRWKARSEDPDVDKAPNKGARSYKI